MTTARQAGTLQGTILVAQSVFPAMGAVLLVPVVPLLMHEYGQMPNARYLIPALLTVPGLCIALFSPLVGWLADRIGRRQLLIFGLIFYGAAGIAPIFLRDFTLVFASRVVLGLGDAIIIVVSAVMVGDYFEGDRRARWLALFGTVAAIGAAIFLALGGMLGDAFGWRGAVAVYALSLLFIPAMLLFTWEPKAPQRTAAAAEAGPAQGLVLHLVITGIITLFGSVLFYTLVLQQGLALAALGTVDPGRLGLLTAIASLGNPIASLVFRRFTRSPTPALLAVAFGLIAVGLLAIGEVTNDIAFTVAAFIGLFGAGLLLPTLLTWTMRALPFSQRGKGTAIFQSAFAAGQFGSSMIVPFVAGLLTGGVLATFAVLGLFTLAATIASGITLARHRANPNPRTASGETA